MPEILGTAKKVRELLKGVKYSIDYYQREYKWEDKQIRELIDDLSGKFLEDYQSGQPRTRVRDYPHYFLGSIILSKRDGESFVVDGQQRLTSLTLLLMHLRELQKGRTDTVNVDELIFSERYGQRSFNLDIDERAAAMQALFEGNPVDQTDQSESVRNLLASYAQIQEEFPVELRDDALPYFVDWLLENVHLVEITAYSDDDAYTIFETMNDRGLSLTPAEMLKGYLLANIEDLAARNTLNEAWRDRVRALSDMEKEAEADFFKTWLRSQYATKIRERRRGARPEDFDRIGTEFHRWLRDASALIGLKESADFQRFLYADFAFYSREYLRLLRASRQLTPGLEHVLYNAHHGFTLQYILLLAPLRVDDSEQDVELKLELVGRFVDILLARRIWNSRSIAYSTMQYAMFLVMRDIRGASPQLLADKLLDSLAKESETFSRNERLRVHQQNRYALHRLLARLTDYVETKSGLASRYIEYVSAAGPRFEIEHIWADHPERHRDEFSHPTDFAEYRNRIGGLLLLPKSFNASYGDLPYAEKLPHYLTQNLLAQSLHPQAYERNPGFKKFIAGSGLAFRPHGEFRKADIEERSKLYQAIAERLWDPEQLKTRLDAAAMPGEGRTHESSMAS